jgi:protein TonB
MISRNSIVYIAIAIGLNVLYVMLGVLGMNAHEHKEVVTPPVIIELIQPKKLEPPPPPKPEPKKPEPKQPEPKQPEPKQPEPKQPEPKQPEPPKQPKVEPVKPEPPTAAEPRPEPPKPEPAKPEPARPAPPSPAPQAAPAPTAPEAPPKPAPQPEAAAKLASAATTPPVKTGVNISASYGASNAKPEITRWSQINREYGTVVLRVLVKSDGTAGSVEIKSSSDYPRLDQSAIKAVKAWRFNPATVDGKSIDEWYEVPIIFKPPNN